MKNTYKVITTLFILALANCYLIAQESARDIYKKASDQLLTENMEIVMEIDITDKKGQIKSKEFSVIIAKFGEEVKTMVYWQKPERAKGTTIIITDVPNETGIIEVYTPSNGKTRKLKATEDNMAMVGNEFKMTEIAKYDTEELNYRLLDDIAIDEISYYNIEVKGKTSSGESRGELLINKNSYQIFQALVFDDKGNKISATELSEYRPVDGIKGKVQPLRIASEDFKNRKSIDMRILNIVARKNISPEIFTLPVENEI